MSPALIPVLLVPVALLLWLSGVFPALGRSAGQPAGAEGPARKTVSAISAASLAFALLIALSALPVALDGEAIRAGFDLPGGLRFALRLDALALAFLAPMLISALAVAVMAGGFIGFATTLRRFQILLLLLSAALAVVILADPVWLVATAWILAAVFAWFLLWHCDDRPGESRVGAMVTLPSFIGALVAGAFLLTGLTDLGSLAGGQEITLISHRGRDIAATGGHVLPAILIVTGAVIGAGLVPFRFGRTRMLFAPAPAVAFLLPAGQGLAALYLFTRLVPAASGEMAGGPPFWAATLAALAVVTVIACGASALVRRGLAGIAEAVLAVQMALALWLAGSGAAAAVVFVVIATLPAATALFLCAGLIRRETGSLRLAVPGGLINRMPLTALIVALALISLAGIAPLSGGHALSATFQALGADSIRPGPGFSVDWLATGAVILAYALVFAALLQAARLARFDAVPPEGGHHAVIRDPKLPLLLVPAGLVAVLVVAGLFPGLVAALAGAVETAATAPELGAARPAITLWPGSDGIIPWAWLLSVGLGFLIHGLRPHPPHIAAQDGG